MSNVEFVQTVQHELRPLIEGAFGELLTNPGTSHYHRLDKAELVRRGEATYQNLLDWLLRRDAGAVRTAGIELGRKRFAEGIPLGQVVLSVLLKEKHLWKYPATAPFSSDVELARASCEFFQSFIYWTARGFAVELESGKDRPGRVVPPNTHAATQKGADQAPAELVSRGGQIGEHGG